MSPLSCDMGPPECLLLKLLFILELRVCGVFLFSQCPHLGYRSCFQGSGGSRPEMGRRKSTNKAAG